LIFRLYIILFICGLISSLVARAQDLEPFDDSQDTLQRAKHPSKKAALFSAIIPGAGQVYNHILLPKSSRRKWNVYWKVPFIYGAIGGSAYMLLSKQNEISELKKEYRFRIGLDGGQQHPQYANYDASAILQLHNASQTQRDLFILTTILAYAINILDASVEAHFINFDVSDDLSFHVQPTTSNFGLGLSLALKFK